MSDKLSKIKEYLPALFKRLPVLFSRHFTYVILAGAILVLFLGAFFFYNHAYKPTIDDYDVFVRVRKVNNTLFEEAKEYLQEDLGRDSLPSRNPFQP